MGVLKERIRYGSPDSRRLIIELAALAWRGGGLSDGDKELLSVYALRATDNSDMPDVIRWVVGTPTEGDWPAAVHCYENAIRQDTLEAFRELLIARWDKLHVREWVIARALMGDTLCMGVRRDQATKWLGEKDR